MELAELPNRRVEAWKYSDLRAALKDAALPDGDAPAPKQHWRVLDGVIDRLALAQGQHATTKVGAGEEEVLIEEMGEDALDARVREIQVLPGGALTRLVLQTGAGVALNAAYVSVGDGAVFRQFVLAEGGKLARIETHVEVDGGKAEIELNGVYICGAGRHADLTSVITHKEAGSQTRQLIKGVAAKGGRGVFQGKIVVERAAQQTDARQYHHGLLLEEGAEVFAKPELMIFADDVQCAHGNTAGALDETALFYARSRGIPEAVARALLIESFLVEAIPAALPEEVAGRVRGRISAWLEARS
jgi:Fe-S cluster assembly protein SufD